MLGSLQRSSRWSEPYAVFALACLAALAAFSLPATAEEVNICTTRKPGLIAAYLAPSPRPFGPTLSREGRGFACRDLPANLDGRISRKAWSVRKVERVSATFRGIVKRTVS